MLGISQLLYSTSDNTAVDVYPTPPFEPIDFSRPENRYLLSRCVVGEAISIPGEYRVRLAGVWWTAQSHNWWPLKTGDTVRVLGRKDLTLLVEPICQGYQFNGSGFYKARRIKPIMKRKLLAAR